MQHPRFREGDLATDFIADEYPDGFDGAPADAQLIDDLAVIAGMVAVITDERAAEITASSARRSHVPCERMVCIGGDEHKVRIKPYKGGTLAVTRRRRPDRHRRPLEARAAAAGGHRRRPPPHRPGPPRRPRLGASDPRRTHQVQVLPPHVAELSKHMIEKPAPDLSRLLLAPMPGLLTKLDVKVGDKVEPGQPVAVMEAMKMENILRAPKAATVKATPAKAGDSLAVDQVIVEFE